MTFTYDLKAGYILFDSFDVQDGAQFFYAILFILLLAVFTEGLTFALWYQQFTASKPAPGDKRIVPRIINSIFFFVLRLLNYCQMLVAMTFNFWIILAIALSQFLAWYVFQDLKDGFIVKKALLMK